MNSDWVEKQLEKKRKEMSNLNNWLRTSIEQDRVEEEEGRVSKVYRTNKSSNEKIHVGYLNKDDCVILREDINEEYYYPTWYYEKREELIDFVPSSIKLRK